MTDDRHEESEAGAGDGGMPPAGGASDGGGPDSTPGAPATARRSGPLDQPTDVGDAAEPEAPPAEPESGRMGLLDHLEELRRVLIQCLLAALVAALLCWAWSADLMELIIRPVRTEGVYFTAPNDAFMARLRVSFVAGLFAVAPFVLFRFYGFVLPGLYRRERRLMTPILVWTVLLFYVGIAFAFFVVAPNVVRFLMGFGTESLKPMIGVSAYLGFVFRLCLGFGLVFELPILVLGLCLAGVVRPQLLLRTWRYAIVIIAIVAAVFTPPDVISQVMMMAPMLVLYLGSVLVALVMVRRRDRERAAAAAAAAARGEGD